MKTLSCRQQRGISLIEFAIVFPVAVMFVLALIQVGFLYMAKMTLNQATFMAARAGSLNNADTGQIRSAMVRGIIPFVQDTTTANDASRLSAAWTRATTLELPFLRIDVMNPSARSFSDFGLVDPTNNRRYIPNDNLEWRNVNIVGTQSQQNIRDANLLKLRTVYGYEMKVPLIAGIVRRVMCGGSIGVAAWGDVNALEAISPLSTDCQLYYRFNRVPIESFAIVEMQSRAYQP